MSKTTRTDTLPWFHGCSPGGAGARRQRWSRHTIAAVVGGTLLLTSCGLPNSYLSPGGVGANHIADITWVIFAMGGITLLLTSFGLLWGMFHPRPADIDPRRPARINPATILIAGAVVPAAVVIALMVFNLRALTALAAPTSTAVTVQVIGHQWWWELHYPNERVVTANEIHIPVGQPVSIQLSTDDVIHSFWVPQLMGKTDLIPGQGNATWIEAQKPGVYHGQCAEFCGLQHAHMLITVVAQPASAFNAWLAAQQTVPPQPTDPMLLKGQQVFLSHPCVSCHTIAGTFADGKRGPDLTHLASRQTIAAGTLPNTTGALAGWIVDPQAIKPGADMPPQNLSGSDLQALVAYLQSLK